MSEHSFNTELAKQYGIECAIVIKNLDFWLSKNKANNKNYHNNKYWTYMSMSGFSEYFDYLTENQVRYILKKLEEKEVIETGNYNKKGYDRTKWYTFTDSFVKNNKSILQYSHIHLGKLPDAFEKITEPIPYTDTDTIKDTDTDINNSAFDDEFLKWWDIYPRKQNKLGSETAYKSLHKKKKLPDLQVHLDIINKWKASGKWDDPQYIPMPSTWLNKQRWNDEIPNKPLDKKSDLNQNTIYTESLDKLFEGNEDLL